MNGFDFDSRRFVRGRGNVLVDARGNELYDAVSSIWTIVHGHCHPAIVEAISRQAATLDHATLLGATNPVAEELADRLCALAGMDRAFLASDGASAIEAAVKMALQFWQNAGEPQRTRFVRLTGSYHGDTAAAMSLSDIGVFKSRFGAIAFETVAYDALETALDANVAAVFVEPIVQAAAGMRVVSTAAYDGLRDMEPLLVVDEIATGFGRTGTMFAFEQLGLQPDAVCVGKGLTGGSLALSATLVRERVYEAFLGDRSEGVHFFHGHSYAGNPIACAAALASLRLFEEERTLERAAAIGAAIERRGEALAGHPAVREIRRAGTMTGIELRGEQARRVVDELYDRGHFTRPIGETVQLVPPLSSSAAEIDAFFDSLEASLQP